MASLGDLIVRIGAETSAFESGAQRVSRSLNDIDKSVERTTGGFDRMFERLTEVGSKLTIGVTLPITAFGAAALKAAIDMDSLERGLAAVSKTGGTVAQQLERLREVAKLPGLGFQEAIQGSIRLQAAGMSAQVAEKALMGFGNALATVGKGRVELEGVITALTQIAAKGKVSAEEINQLAERLPQIRELMRGAFGTADTEVLQKMGIGAQEFIAKIILELEKLPKVTGGVKNDLENLRDSVEQTFASFGKSLIPALQSLLQAATPILDWVKEAAIGFASLPQPIQTTAIGIAAFVAAVGPLAFAIGQAGLAVTALKGALTILSPIFAATAVKVGGFITSLLGIGPAASATTIALGALQGALLATAAAIAAIQVSKAIEAYMALRAAQQDFARATQDTEVTANKLYEALKKHGVVIERGSLSLKDWSDKLRAAASVINSTTAATKGSEDAFKGLNATQRSLAEVYVKLGMSASDARKQVLGLATGIRQSGAQAKEAADDYKVLAKAFGEMSGKSAVLLEEYRQEQKAHDDLVKSIATHELAISRLVSKYKDLPSVINAVGDNAKFQAASWEELNAELAKTAPLMEAAKRQAMDWSKIPAPNFPDALTEAAKRTKAAVDSLGAESSEALRKRVEETRGHWEQIVALYGEGAHNSFVAERNMYLAVKDEAEKTGKEMNANDAARLAELEAMLGAHAEKQKATLKSVGKEVQKYLTELSGKLADTFTELILHGGRVADALKAVVEDVAKTITQVLIKGAINDLLHSLKLLNDETWNLGVSLQRVFGGGSKGAKTATSAAGAASDATSAVDGIGGIGNNAGTGASTGILGGGITGWGTFVGTAISAVTDIIGAFQTARMEKDLARVEVTTREIKAETMNRRKDAWDQHNYILSKWDIQHDLMRQGIQAIKDVGTGGASEDMNGFTTWDKLYQQTVGVVLGGFGNLYSISLEVRDWTFTISNQITAVNGWLDKITIKLGEVVSRLDLALPKLDLIALSRGTATGSTPPAASGGGSGPTFSFSNCTFGSASADEIARSITDALRTSGALA